MSIGSYARQDKFFKKLFAINQDWFDVRSELTKEEDRDLSLIIDNIASSIQDIEFMG